MDFETFELASILYIKLIKREGNTR